MRFGNVNLGRDEINCLLEEEQENKRGGWQLGLEFSKILVWLQMRWMFY